LSLLDDLVLEPVHAFQVGGMFCEMLCCCLGVIGTVCKRVETSLRTNKCEYTGLGALALDSDVLNLLHYTKVRLYGDEYQSQQAVAKVGVTSSESTPLADCQTFECGRFGRRTRNSVLDSM
jgi:hypothetical protein